jgi:TonB-dependent receptor
MFVAAALAQSAQAASTTPDQAGPQQAVSQDQIEEVVVKGFRASLESSTKAKRDSVTFSDSVFAEDIGKFPDLNIAESLNRIPGIQLTREVNGDGLNISIRGLGTNFTKITLNGAQVAVASTGRTDAQDQNREVDLDLFPTELFTRLDVNKTPTASMIDGGVSGVVDMHPARPFDKPGRQLTFQLQEGYGEVGKNYSPRGAVLASVTSDTFGVLAGVAAVRNKSTTNGYETIGWTNPTITYGMCGTTPPPTSNFAGAAPTCNTTGGNGWSQPGTSTTTGFGVVPNGVGNGLVAGTPIDAAFLLAHNPGLTLNQISNALIPRLGREAYLNGNRDRVAEIVSLEYRPSDTLHFYLDTMYAEGKRNFDRIDMDLVGRNGGIIPLNLQVDANNVVTSGTFANAQYFLEARPYREEVQFYNINPGMHYQATSWLGVDFQLNRTRSDFLRDSPTVLINSPLGQGVTVNYTNNGGIPGTANTNFNLNDPNAGWTWAGGRVNIQDEKRMTQTRGGHLDVQFGTDPWNVKVGGAFDDVQRIITPYDNSAAWQTAICGGNVAYTPGTSAAACTGGGNSLVPQSALASYLAPGPAGFVTIDFPRILAASNYYNFDNNPPISNTSNTSANMGGVREKTWGEYLEFNGHRDVWGRNLRVNAGLRYVDTNQTISGPYLVGGVAQRGPWQNLITDYSKVLPSMNMAYNVTDTIVGRFSASRTITRPNPSAMLPATNFSDPSGATASQGNPLLQPYLSKNIDFGGEWYTGREGYLGLTLFQKKMDGFTVGGTSTIPFSQLGIDFNSLGATQQAGINSRGGPNAATVVVTQQINANGLLTIRGLEANWVQPLGRWFERLEGFGYTLNYTHIAQHSDGTGAPAQAYGISPKTYNGTVYYDRNGLSVRVSYVWGAAQVSTGGGQNGIGAAQLYADSYGQWDMSASYELPMFSMKPQITLNAINFTNEKQRSYFQFQNAAYTLYQPGYQIMLGIRGKF